MITILDANMLLRGRIEHSPPGPSRFLNGRFHQSLTSARRQRHARGMKLAQSRAVNSGHNLALEPVGGHEQGGEQGHHA